MTLRQVLGRQVLSCMYPLRGTAIWLLPVVVFCAAQMSSCQASALGERITRPGLADRQVTVFMTLRRCTSSSLLACLGLGGFVHCCLRCVNFWLCSASAAVRCHSSCETHKTRILIRQCPRDFARVRPESSPSRCWRRGARLRPLSARLCGRYLCAWRRDSAACLATALR